MSILDSTCGLPSSRAARQHRAARLVPCPIGAALRETLASWLIVVRPAQHLEELVDTGGVALLGAVDRLLRKIVAQHVARIDGAYPRASLLGRRFVEARARCVTRQPV